ncbi:MAG: alpha/beta fold hydrolase [Acetobacteraceae bacterium]
MSEEKFFEVKNFQTQRGGVLPVARLAYRTLGALNGARDNAVLIPSWYSGTNYDSETFLTGEGRALDPNKYFLILTDLFGSGASSSPSNTQTPFDQGRFPHVTFHDNVRLQHLMVTEKLTLERLRLVAGWSMGAAQTFEWACQFPEMVEAACPIAGSARTANYNKVFLLALRRALELDPAFKEGFYDRPPVAGLRAFAAIYAGWGTSEPFFRTAVFAALGSRSWDEHVGDFWEPFFLRCDANNLLCQLWTWQEGDISANATHRGDFKRALGSIRARTIVLPVDTDRYFPPPDSQYEAQHIPNGVCRVVPSIWGHMAPMNPADVPTIDAALNELLAR